MARLGTRSQARRGVIAAVCVFAAVGVVGGGLAARDAVRFASHDRPPPDLAVDDPELFWGNLSPEQRADVLSEYPPEDGQTIPALSQAELQAELESIGEPEPIYPETGIVDDPAIHWGPFDAINGWQEVVAAGRDHHYVISYVFAGYNREGASRPGMVYIWAKHPWPGSDADRFAGDHDLYTAPSGFGPLKLVSADGHLLSLASANDPKRRVILTFDLKRRAFTDARR